MIWILLCLLLLLCAIVYVVYRIAFYSPNRTQNDDYNIAHTAQMDPLRETITGMIDALGKIPYERVSMVSRDGLKLQARYYHQSDDAPLVLCFHGYRGTPFRDFSGGTALYRSAGFNLLMVEQRAHCSSEGHTITFGVKERYDCLDWIEFARERFGDERAMLLAGISMGAATVLMASGLELPQNVRGVIADAPYTSPKAIIQKVCGDMGLPVRLAMPFASVAARVFGGFGLTDANAAEAVQHATVPILLIHGEDDRFVPCDMGREIAAAAPERVELHTFPNAGHGLSFLVDQPRYERITKDFFARVLPHA